jgi:hypothetical protein
MPKLDTGYLILRYAQDDSVRVSLPIASHPVRMTIRQQLSVSSRALSVAKNQLTAATPTGAGHRRMQMLERSAAT